MAEVRWTPQAAADLESVADFIARDSAEYAAHFATEVLEAVEQLEDFPRSGRVVPELGDPHTREIIYGHYRIAYRISGDVLEILTVHQGAQPLDASKLQ
jgi:plasmid stabilization system protein ParE